MTRHSISLTRQKGVAADREITAAVKAAVRAVLKQQRVETRCEVAVYLCSDEEIRRLNREFRNIDRPTDVLSFPEYDDPSAIPTELPEGETAPLGDIAISAETADRQAVQYGHSRAREYAFLAAHATLHLLGFDHERGPEQEKQHFEAQERALEAVGITRPAKKRGRCGTVSILGRPNVGKSTLLNRLVGEKIAIVSPKPQTTRSRITGVLTRGDTQYIFMDTPGLHKPKNRLDEHMNRTVYETAGQVDAALLVVEPVASPGKPERLLIETLERQGIAYIVVINKLDTLPRENLLAIIASYSACCRAAAIIPISAKKEDGIQPLLEETAKLLPKGEFLFDEDELTDQPERVIAAEYVREKLLGLLSEEIPHGIATETERYTEREDGVCEIDVVITCERDSHKKIIIGKNGSLLKTAGELSRVDMEKLFGTKVFLSLWVRVKNNWRDDDYFIRDSGITGVE